jgi:glycosyltransferase involved in cell wall biosynthesis
MNEKNLITVGVAMCTFNGEKFLREQLESILAQTYPIAEINIFDDCSTDGTWQIAEEYSKKYHKINIFRNPAQIGFNKNFEQAFCSISSDVIAFSDQDDVWRADKIAVMMQKWTGEEPLIYCSSVRFRDRVPENPTFPASYRRFEGTDIKKILFYNTVSGHASLIKTAFRDKFLPFAPDFYFDWRAAQIAATLGGVAYTNEILVFQRAHENNASFNDIKVTLLGGIKRLKKEVFNNLAYTVEFPDLSEEDRKTVKKLQFLFGKNDFLSRMELFFLIMKFRKELFHYKNKKILFFSHLKYAFYWAILA